MDPPPTAFRGAFREKLSPRQIFNALTHGVAGTAMPSYALAYDEQQRWDVAFFVPTLRVGFAPQRSSAGVAPSLEELVSSSNVEACTPSKRIFVPGLQLARNRARISSKISVSIWVA
jgi:hypothetical protein